MNISELMAQSFHAALGIGGASAPAQGEAPRRQRMPVGLRSIANAADSFTPARLGNLMRDFGLDDASIAVATQESARIMQEQVGHFLGTIGRRAEQHQPAGPESRDGEHHPDQPGPPPGSRPPSRAASTSTASEPDEPPPPPPRHPVPAQRHPALARMSDEEYLKFMHDRDHYVDIGSKNSLALIGGSGGNKRPPYLRDHDHASSAGDGASSAGDSDVDDDDHHS
ncbi:hypothetical protein [Duganella hordei]|uniref:hypothetical protein n=1 Tax=Duganella hordei TaxID=2865934 RepID=UPI0030E7A94C